MKKAIIIAAFMVSGCARDAPKPPQPKPRNICEFAIQVLNNQWASVGDKALALEVLRVNECGKVGSPVWQNK